MHRIQIFRPALRFLKAINPTAAGDIREAIDSLAQDPYPAWAKEPERRPGFYRIRAGDYRMIYKVNDASGIVFVERIGHRGDVYRYLER